MNEMNEMNEIDIRPLHHFSVRDRSHRTSAWRGEGHLVKQRIMVK